MATCVRGATCELLLKGAPEVVMSFCDWALSANAEGIIRIPIATVQGEMRERLEGFQSQGMRTLAFAVREVAPGEGPLFVEGRVAVGGYTLVALVAINDPVRPDVPAAIQEVRNAGVDVKIVTGDTILTTRSIARQIGLWDDTCGTELALSGSEFAAMGDEEALAHVKALKIM